MRLQIALSKDNKFLSCSEVEVEYFSLFGCEFEYLKNDFRW
jgi:hypothetical protein